jgi:ABC-type transporter Mla subunit MlaD
MLEDGEIQQSIKNILRNAEVATNELNSLIPAFQLIATNLNDLTTSVKPILGDKDVHNDLRATVSNLRQASQGLTELMDNSNVFVTNMNQETRPKIDTLVVSMTETSGDLQTLLEAFVGQEQ